MTVVTVSWAYRSVEVYRPPAYDPGTGSREGYCLPQALGVVVAVVHASVMSDGRIAVLAGSNIDGCCHRVSISIRGAGNRWGFGCILAAPVTQEMWVCQ